MKPAKPKSHKDLEVLMGVVFTLNFIIVIVLLAMIFFLLQDLRQELTTVSDTIEGINQRLNTWEQVDL